MSETPVVWTSRLTAPGAGPFAVLFGIEALGRALVAVALLGVAMRRYGRADRSKAGEVAEQRRYRIAL